MEWFANCARCGEAIDFHQPGAWLDAQGRWQCFGCFPVASAAPDTADALLRAFCSLPAGQETVQLPPLETMS